MHARADDSVTLSELLEILRPQYEYASETHEDGSLKRLRYREALDELWQNVLKAVEARRDESVTLHPILNAALVKRPSLT